MDATTPQYEVFAIKDQDDRTVQIGYRVLTTSITKVMGSKRQRYSTDSTVLRYERLENVETRSDAIARVRELQLSSPTLLLQCPEYKSWKKRYERSSMQTSQHEWSFYLICIDGLPAYVGRTKRFKRRWTQHKSNLRHNRHHNPGLQALYNASETKAVDIVVLEKAMMTPALAAQREEDIINVYSGLTNVWLRR